MGLDPTEAARTFAVDLPVFVCQGGGLQALATLGAAEAGLVPGLRDGSRARSDSSQGQGNNALATKWVPLETQNHEQRGLERTKTLLWKSCPPCLHAQRNPPAPGGGHRGETSDVVPAPTLSPFKSLQPTCSSRLRQQVRRSHPLFGSKTQG